MSEIQRNSQFSFNVEQFKSKINDLGDSQADRKEKNDALIEAFAEDEDGVIHADEFSRYIQEIHASNPNIFGKNADIYKSDSVEVDESPLSSEKITKEWELVLSVARPEVSSDKTYEGSEPIEIGPTLFGR